VLEQSNYFWLVLVTESNSKFALLLWTKPSSIRYVLAVYLPRNLTQQYPLFSVLCSQDWNFISESVKLVMITVADNDANKDMHGFYL